MTDRSTDSIAERSARVLAQLEGSLDQPTLGAMSDIWGLLERSAVDGDAHARAVRARMFWQSVAAQGTVAEAAATLPAYEAPAVAPHERGGDMPYADAA